MRNLAFFLLIAISLTVNAQTPGPEHGTSGEVSLKALTPRMDDASAKPRTEKPVMLKGTLSMEDLIRSEPNLDWANWAKVCGKIVSSAISDNGTPDSLKGTQYDIVIFPFGMMTTRPQEFRMSIGSPRCPPFPKGTSVRRIVMGVDINNNKSKFRENYDIFIKNMDIIIRDRNEQ